VYANASLVDWWGSDAFGQRRLLVLLPILGLGLGEAITVAKRWPLALVAGLFGVLAFWNLQFEYIYNSGLVAGKGEAVTLDRLLPAQVGVLYRSLLRSQESWPRPLWLAAYDNLSGIWLDEGPRSLGGRLELGRETTDPLFRPVGDGWFAPESEGEVSFRRVRGRRAWLRLPVRTPADRALVVRIRAEFDAREPVEVALEWNGLRSPGQRLAREWVDLRFEVAGTAMRSGLNDVALVFSAAPRGTIEGFTGRNAPAAVASLRAERAGVTR
jgi:hypothetical protein